MTGAATGIGRATAEYLARRGFGVWAGVRTEPEARELQSIALDGDGWLRAVQLDVTDARSIRSASAQISAQPGEPGLRGIINNAGVCIVAPAEFTPLDDWRRQFETNLFGAVGVTQAMLPLLRAYSTAGQRIARIINMGSITGEIAPPLFAAYGASKFALRAFSDALRLELRSQGICVSLIIPGAIQSRIWEKEKECVEALGRNASARQRYGTLIDNVAGYVFGCAAKAIPADRVADVVHRCLTARRPRPNYLLGWEAHVGARAKRFLPGRLLEFLLCRAMGVPSRAVLGCDMRAAEIEPA